MPITGEIEKKTTRCRSGWVWMRRTLGRGECGGERCAGCRLGAVHQGREGRKSKYTEAYFRVTSETEVSPDFESLLEASAGGHIHPEAGRGSLTPWKKQHPQLRALGFTDPEVINTFSQGVPPAIAWLKQFGVRLEALPTQFITQATPRLLPVGGGQAIVDGLAGWAETHCVTFHYQTTARELLQDATGAVKGVRAISADGKLTKTQGIIKGSWSPDEFIRCDVWIEAVNQLCSMYTEHSLVNGEKR